MVNTVTFSMRRWLTFMLLYFNMVWKSVRSKFQSRTGHHHAIRGHRLLNSRDYSFVVMLISCSIRVFLKRNAAYLGCHIKLMAVLIWRIWWILKYVSVCISMDFEVCILLVLPCVYDPCFLYLVYSFGLSIGSWKYWLLSCLNLAWLLLYVIDSHLWHVQVLKLFLSFLCAFYVFLDLLVLEI